MTQDYILKKNVDWSLFNRGFAIPVKMQNILALHLSAGFLNHGEKRNVKIILNDKTFEVTLTSVNFDRRKYPEHKDIWQIIYSPNGNFASCLKNIFESTFNEIVALREKNLKGNFEESVVLYTTDLKDTFYIETIFADEIKPPAAVESEQNLENLFEMSTLTDSEAAIIEKYKLTKIRKLNRSIGNYLKKLYNFHCQICGESVGEIYGVKIVECHHINYFVQSLNNDIDNLLIVCPNHHRIIHAANPTFDRQQKIYIYPNGYAEGLKLNLHL